MRRPACWIRLTINPRVSHMTDQLSEQERAAYQALVRVVFGLPRVITADSGAADGLGLSDFAVLEALAVSLDRRLRMTELASACGLSASGVSRIMNRLDRTMPGRPASSRYPRIT